jgi:hypothetical protein
MADGVENDPIVFTSGRGVKKKQGDWEIILWGRSDQYPKYVFLEI